MKVSGSGAAVGAFVGFFARGTVVLLNFSGGSGVLGFLALPSAGIGALVGAIAGAMGKPLCGALVGAILSGIVFEFFMIACASMIGRIDQKASGNFLSESLLYGFEMAFAGALAGGIGGAVAKRSERRNQSKRDDNPGASVSL